MNKLTIIGNLTRDPELRTLNGDIKVCSFTVAVNRRRQSQDGQHEADYFRVTAWRALGETCNKYLAKGRKVCVVGPVSVNTYAGSDGQTRASLEVNADEVEFLSSREGGQSTPKQEPAQEAPQDGGRNYVPVSGEDDLPF